jgi:hypothetical protein
MQTISMKTIVYYKDGGPEILRMAAGFYFLVQAVATEKQ